MRIQELILAGVFALGGLTGCTEPPPDDATSTPAENTSTTDAPNTQPETEKPAEGSGY